MIRTTNNSITITNGSETIKITAWGRGLRVSSVPYGQIPPDDAIATVSALEPVTPQHVVIKEENQNASIENCGIRCEVWGSRLRFMSNERVLLEEMEYEWPLHESARRYRPQPGSDGFEATFRFKAYDGEKLHGMGQYRTAKYDMKGCILELAHRNSQISIPFVVSNRGYGFLWNNAGIGTASFAENITEWKTYSTRRADYWICAGENPAEIIEKYTEVTGRASELPDDLLGLWQCKLRYRTQDELLSVAREYKRRGIKLDVIVIDFFHWIYQGDWSFDPKYWPDPQAMVDELNEMGTKLMVSVWPTVDPRSENYHEFAHNGWLVSTDRGLNDVFDFNGPERIYDATNSAARKFAYETLKKNYGQYGIQMYWQDEAEPEYSVYDYDLYRYYIGSDYQVGNIFPRMHSQMLYEGLKEDGVKAPINLIRCAWVGSPKYGALVWSGDIDCTFAQMKRQIWNGINMGTAGIPYWISDIGGFYGGNINDPVFRELIVRWYQWAVFTPVLRMHGDRQPNIGALTHDTDKGGGFCSSGADNELWSYGEENYKIFLKYLDIRQKLKPYIKAVADECQKTGLPMIRAMYIEFPNDEKSWDVDDQYMFGKDYLVAPVTDYGVRERNVYLPAGKWEAMDNSCVMESKGEYVTAAAPLDYMPVFKRMD